MTKFFNNLKKTIFGLFGSFLFLGQKKISKNQTLSRTTTNGLLGPYQNLEKTNIRFQKTCGRHDEQNDGRKGKQILFY